MSVNAIIWGQFLQIPFSVLGNNPDLRRGVSHGAAGLCKPNLPCCRVTMLVRCGSIWDIVTDLHSAVTPKPLQAPEQHPAPPHVTVYMILYICRFHGARPPRVSAVHVVYSPLYSFGNSKMMADNKVSDFFLFFLFRGWSEGWGALYLIFYCCFGTCRSHGTL